MLAKLTTLNIVLLIIDSIVLIVALFSISFPDKVSGLLKNRAGYEPERIKKSGVFLLICAIIAFTLEIINVFVV